MGEQLLHRFFVPNGVFQKLSTEGQAEFKGFLGKANVSVGSRLDVVSNASHEDVGAIVTGVRDGEVSFRKEAL